MKAIILRIAIIQELHGMMNRIQFKNFKLIRKLVTTLVIYLRFKNSLKINFNLNKIKNKFIKVIIIKH